MVNYCCVYGCGRNSRSNKHFNYYGLPKDEERRNLWLQAAGRQELLTIRGSGSSYRFCSRHFTPNSIKKNRHLSPDAVPTLCLPGSWSDEDTSPDSPNEPVHSGLICNSCEDTIIGFCYKCVSCTDYDLCQKCEMLEVHPNHYMLRLPRPTKFAIVDDLIKKCRKLFKDEDLTSKATKNNESTIEIATDSSDDEPITKYAITRKSKNYDSGVDLSEDVKSKIRKEVSRMLKRKPKESKKLERKQAEKRRSEPIVGQSKKMKAERDSSTLNTYNVEMSNAPEVAFADVNEVKDCQIMELKSETSMLPPAVQLPQGSMDDLQQPVMHVKLSDDLTELMIEVTSNNQRTIYKYSDNYDQINS